MASDRRIQSSVEPMDDRTNAMSSVFEGLSLNHDPASKKLLVIAQSIKEYISTMNALEKDPTSNEFFAAIAVTLEGSDRSESPNLICLLNLVLPSVSDKIVSANAERVLDAVYEVVEDEGMATNSGEKTKNVSECLKCIGILLEKIERNLWKRDSSFRAFDYLLQFCGSQNDIVSNVAMNAVLENLKEFSRKNSKIDKRFNNPASILTKFCAMIFNRAELKDSNKAIGLLELATKSSAYLSQSECMKLVKSVVNVIKSCSNKAKSNELVLKSIMCVSGIIQSPKIRQLSADEMSEIFKMMVGILPNLHLDSARIEAPVAFIQALASLIVCLRGEGEAAMSSGAISSVAMKTFFEAIGVFFVSGNNKIFPATSSCLYLAVQTVLLGNGAEAVRISSDSVLLVESELRNLLQHKFRGAWPSVLSVIGRIFFALKQSAYPIFNSLILEIDTIHSLLKTVPTLAMIKGLQHAIREATSLIVRSIGIKNFLSVLPLIQSEQQIGIYESKSWLIEILRENGAYVPSELTYFFGVLIPIIENCLSASRNPNLSEIDRNHQKLKAEQIWGLLPVFFLNSVDLPENSEHICHFLGKKLCEDNPKITMHICRGLVNLVDFAEQSKNETNLNCIGKIGTHFLPVLINFEFKGASKDDNLVYEKLKTLKDAIRSLVRIVPRITILNLLGKLLKKLLIASENGTKLLSCALMMDAVSSLVVHSDEEGAHLVFKTCKFFLGVKPKETQFCKAMYKVLHCLCEAHGSLLAEAEFFDEMAEFVAKSAQFCHSSARCHRLKVIQILVERCERFGRAKQEVLVARVFLEVVMDTLHVSVQTRECSYGVLITMCHALGEDAVLFKCLGCLTGESTAVRSAGILAVGRLFYEFAHSNSANQTVKMESFVPKMIGTALILISQDEKEVVRNSLGLLKLAVGGSSPGVIEPLLKDIIDGIMVKIGPKFKVQLKDNIKAIFHKLCHKFGFEKIKGMVPEDDKKLIKALHKEKKREIRDKNAKKKKEEHMIENNCRFESEMNRQTGRKEKIESNGIENNKSRNGGNFLLREKVYSDSDSAAEDSDEIIDLMEESNEYSKKIVRLASREDDGISSESDGEELEFKYGKLLIQEDEEEDKDVGNKRGRSDDESDESGEGPVIRRKRGGKRKVERKEGRKGDKRLKVSGSEYRSKRARGDVLRKGQRFEPYAFIPLNAKKLLSKKNKGKMNDAVGEYSAAIKRGKRGYIKRHGKSK